MAEKSSPREAAGKVAGSAEMLGGGGGIIQFSQLLGQPRAVERLQAALQSGRMPSAWIFHGVPHVGKRTAARILGAVLNCEALLMGDGLLESGGLDACGVCASCKMAAAGVHSQVIEVLPQGEGIKIDQVRETIDKLALVAPRQGRRVVIFGQAETMRKEAANALLKTLEEPLGGGLLVLCLSRLEQLPETVASRCVALPFNVLPADALRMLLGDRGLSGEALEFAVRFGQGGVDGLLGEHAHAWRQVRGDVLQLLENPQRSFEELSAGCASWAKGEDWRFVLDWLEGWFRDLLALKSGVGRELLVNGDCLEVLQGMAERMSFQAIARAHQMTLQTQQQISLWHANKQLALEQMWLHLGVLEAGALAAEG